MDKVIVGIADIKVAKSPAIIKTNLGSCIAVCLYSASAQCGGMLHLMMPEAPTNKEILKKAKYADTGIPDLVRQLKRLCGPESSDTFIAKIFGGAKVLANIKTNIGQQNDTAVRAILKELGIKIVASQVGGEKGYKVEFDVSSGKVQCQVFGAEVKEF